MIANSLILACDSFNFSAQNKNKTYLCRNKKGVWETREIKGMHAKQTLEAILKEIKNQQNASLDPKTFYALATAVKRIKVGYDTHYNKVGAKFFEGIRMIFTGKRKKESVHELCKEIKLQLKQKTKIPPPPPGPRPKPLSPSSPESADSEKEVDFEGVKDITLKDYKKLSKEEKSQVALFLKDKLKKENCNDKIVKMGLFLTVTYPIKTLKNMEQMVNSAESIMNQISQDPQAPHQNKEQALQLFKKFLSDVEAFNHGFYKTYKEICKQSRGPQPIEGLRLIFKGKTKKDIVEMESKAIKQKIQQLYKITPIPN